MKALGCLLIFFLVGFLVVINIGFSILGSIFRAFGGGRRTPTTDNIRQPEEEPKKKIFEDNEGEYIDYEEVDS